MRYLGWTLAFAFFLASSASFARSCKDFDEAAKMMKTSQWMAKSRAYREAKMAEPVVELLDHEQAVAYAYRFPAFKEFGFGSPNKNEWKRVVSRLEKSASHGKTVGWERKLENGNWARIRLDYDPKLGAHYNIEMIVKNPQTARMETHKLAIKFGCGDIPCTEAQELKYVEKIQN